MSLSINNNFMALNTSRHLNSSYSRLSVSMRRLSSGLRVGTAADDAAGLAIRELMRADITALHQGIRNANDAISMIQTADGALAVIDEKLIRMKELAEQAATGTYDSTQRLMIDSEFQAMAAEIDRIAHATDFNGIKLLDGSLAGEHDGSGLNAAGKMKIHFGTGNDSAEDYYYVEIGDCTLAGLGLRKMKTAPANADGSENTASTNGWIGTVPYDVDLNNCTKSFSALPKIEKSDKLVNVQDLVDKYGNTFKSGVWYGGGTLCNNFMFVIPKDTTNVIINILGVGGKGNFLTGDNDIEIFTKSGQHIAGTPLTDEVWSCAKDTNIDYNKDILGFDSSQYDGSKLNSGPTVYDTSHSTLNYTTFNNMLIGYSGDPEYIAKTTGHAEYLNECADYEIVTIDHVTEDLIVWLNGKLSASFQVYLDVTPTKAVEPVNSTISAMGDIISIGTQEKAQKALVAIDGAIVKKDQIRAHLGALQNRFENTVTNLSIQAENLQASESRISDADVAEEMTEFVRNQILAQSAVAMLTQANSLPRILADLLAG